MKLTRRQKGAIAEAEITAAALHAGVGVLRPVTEGTRYDLVFDLGERFLRVQCKWACLGDGVVTAVLRTSRHTPTNGYVHTTYTARDVDCCALFCAPLRRTFLVPIAEVAGAASVRLRVAPARNNQRTGVRMADAYDLAKMIRDPGAIAQLGERRHGMAEVVGSSPTSSIP